jgi:asparagine synthase (glutamine-hydrolysing)
MHRGPDEGSLHTEPGVGLGHRRLSIIDIATGQQPLFNEDGSVVVVFNGEIYNYQQLIPELQALGHVFHTKSDTEVIVHAWESWGADCVKRFRGMFAFALWDRNARPSSWRATAWASSPCITRCWTTALLLFGSELKSVLAHGGLRRDIDPLAVEEYFALGYVAEPRTIFKQARKLPPGTAWHPPRRAAAASRSNTGMCASRWTTHLAGRRAGRTGAAPARVGPPAHDRRGAAGRVPVRRCRQQRRGGTDGRLSSGPVNTCSIGFDDPAFNESEFAQMVADRYQTNHRLETVKSDDFDLIDTLARLYDEPYADSSAIPTYRVCQLARKHVTVALSGDGGDESFGGYRRYRCT